MKDLFTTDRSARLAQALSSIVLVAGGLLRFAVWLQNRSLFIDEANLARNFCEPTPAGFFTPLAYDQYAPPVYNAIERLLVQVFGQTEPALRLFPLLGGLIALALFYRLAQQFISAPWVRLMVVWIFSFSDILLRYSTEGKPYSIDLAVALGLVAWSLAPDKRRRNDWWFALAGAVALWLSMPAVFVLFGAGLRKFGKSVREKDVPAMLRASGTTALWLASFALNYWLVLRPSLGIPALVESHKAWFFPLLPTTAAELRQARDLLLSFPYYTAGYTVLALTTGSAGILGGLIYLFWKRIDRAVAVALPALSCVVVSGFGQYSLAPRMLVWAFPLVLLVQGVGWQWAWDKATANWRWALMLALVMTAGLQRAWQYIWTPYAIEEIRPVLETLSREFKNGDVVYVSHEAWPAVAYYTQCYANRSRFPYAAQLVKGDWNSRPNPEILRPNGRHPQRFWLVYSHVISDVSRQQMEQDLQAAATFAQPDHAISQPGAFAYLYTR